MPSRKWWVNQVTAIGAWVVAVINASWHIGAALQIVAVGIVVGAVSTYLVPNAEPAPAAATLEGGKSHTRAATRRRPTRKDAGGYD